MKVELHVEELVLEGFRPADRHRIGAAFERELARLLAAGGLPPQWTRGASPADGMETSRLDAGSFAARPAARPEAVGRQIAGAVYGGAKR